MSKKKSLELVLTGAVSKDEHSEDFFLLKPKPESDHFLRIPKPAKGVKVTVTPKEALERGGMAEVTISPDVKLESVHAAPASFLKGSIANHLLHSAVATSSAVDSGELGLSFILPPSACC